MSEGLSEGGDYAGLGDRNFVLLFAEFQFHLHPFVHQCSAPRKIQKVALKAILCAASKFSGISIGATQTCLSVRKSASLSHVCIPEKQFPEFGTDILQARVTSLAVLCLGSLLENLKQTHRELSSLK